MEKYVIDASVILSYLLSENKKIEKEVENLLIKAQKKKIKLYSSELLKLEVGNGLRFMMLLIRNSTDMVLCCNIGI